MHYRFANATGIVVLLGCLIWLLAGRTDPVLESAASRLGETWFRLVLDHQHVGFLHSRASRDALGRWRFDSDLRFVLVTGHPVRIQESLLFDGAPPYALRWARQHSEQPGSSEGTFIERQAAGYRVSRTGNDAGSDAGALELEFSLADYLGLETWLRDRAPHPGSTVAAAALDFTRRQVVPRQFRVVEKNTTGYQLEHAAPLDASRIQLDDRMRPVFATVAGLFELQQTTRAEALAPRTALQTASYFVPADRPLPDHTRIDYLELEVRGRVAAADLWPALADGPILRQTANAVSRPALGGDELVETADHPVSDPRIRAMAGAAVAGIADRRAQVAALTAFVHGYLHYQDDTVRRSVLGLLDDPTGSCTAFADLLTTLARSLGIPSRTVFGLAYADERPPAFRFHAWNELWVDDEWLVVDPTWNQLRVDATHIPMPDNVARSLQLLTGGLDLSFVVRDVRYALQGD